MESYGKSQQSLAIKKSIKGFYRRGIAYIELNEFDKARKDWKNVREMENAAGIEKNDDLDQIPLIETERKGL